MLLSLLWRTLSWLWPIRTAQVDGRHGPLEVRWEYGRKVLNSSGANQSFGSLHRVWQQVFRHPMVRQLSPADVLLLGLGGGSVVHILRHELGSKAPITAVEMDPAMVHLARTHFRLDACPDVHVVTGDAVIQVQAMEQRFGLVVVDLFDDLDLARGVDTRGFAHGLRDRCAENGAVCFNTVSYDAASEARCERVLAHLRTVFVTVTELRTEGINRVFIAR